jgi:hypothetical protein
MRSLPRIPVTVLTLILAAGLHADWHLARPAHHRLSLDWPYHWVATAGLFAAAGWIIARFWPARRWRLGAMVFLGAVVLAQVVEPTLEALVYEGRFGYSGESARWTAFWTTIAASAVVFTAALWLCVPRAGTRRLAD